MVSAYCLVRYCKTYGQFELAVDTQIPMRGITGLFGPSGCGKSSLLHVLAGFEPSYIKCSTRRPSHQQQNYLALVPAQTENNPTLTVWQEGKRAVSTHKRRIGYLFQRTALFPHLTVQKNLNYAWKRVPIQERQPLLSPASLAQLLGIEDWLSRYPHELSGGQQQRVALARALASCPRWLLLDEPFANLDKHHRQVHVELLKQLHQVTGLPMLYVTHQMDELLTLADDVLMMEQGQIVAQGALSEVLQHEQGHTALQGYNLLQGKLLQGKLLQGQLNAYDKGLVHVQVAGTPCVFADPHAGQTNAVGLSGQEFQKLEYSEQKQQALQKQKYRIYFHEQDVSLSLLQKQDGQQNKQQKELQEASIQNKLPARIVQCLETEHPALIRTRLELLQPNGTPSQQHCFALLTKKAWHAMSLHVGQDVCMQIKATVVHGSS